MRLTVRNGGRSLARLATLLWIAVPSPVAAAERASWLEVRTDRFVVATDAGAGSAVEVARALEEIEAALVSTSPGPTGRHEALPVLAFARSRDFVFLLPDYRPRGGAGTAVAGAFFSGSSSDEIVLRLDAHGVSRRSVVYHEAVHSFTRRLLPGLPMWLEEGLAELWATAVLTSDPDCLEGPCDEAACAEGLCTRVILGAGHGPHLRRLRREGELALAELVRSERQRALEPEEAARLYASAWAVTHYLVLGGGLGLSVDAPWEEVWRRLERYVDRCRELGDPLVAFEEELGSVDVMATVLPAYLATKPLPSRSWDLVLAPFFPLSRPLREAEVEATLGGFLVRRGATEAARPHLSAALRAEPDLQPAVEAMGLLAHLEGDHAQAVALLSRALDERAREQTVRPLLLSTLSREAGPDRKPEGAVNVIRRLVSLRPDLAPAWIQLAQTYAEHGAPWDLVDQACGQAVATRPDSPWFRLLLARALLVGGREEEAAREAREATRLALAGDDATTANNLCWYGAVGGLAEAVLPACEHAVRLEPERGLYRDSRALVRALQGDLEGAEEDFRAFLSSPDGAADPMRAERLEWLRSLEAGEMPFVATVLERLSDLPF